MAESKDEKKKESKDKKIEKELEEKDKRIESLEKSLEEEKKRAEDYLNRLKYLQADFDNYRKRVEKERGNIIRREKALFINRILVILDELELAIKNQKEAKEKDILVEGVEMIYNKLFKLLCEEGVCVIDAVGKSFNPDLHEAYLTVQTEEHPNNTIVEELRKGYMLEGKVVRPSIVKVAKNPVKNEVNVEHIRDN